MARPREFDERAVLDAAIQCFWSRGYDATSVRDLAGSMGITGASLYNSFADKQALYRKALDDYVASTIADRIRRCEAMAPRDGIARFFAEILARSLDDPDHKGCMVVNAALEASPRDPALREVLAVVLLRIEAFFRRRVEAGQCDGSIHASRSADDLGRHYLGVLMGVRVLARVRPERDLLEGVVRPALALLDVT